MIIETNKIVDILLHINNDTIVIFDIDDTLLQATKYVGSQTFEKHMQISFRKNGLSKEEAINKADIIWTKLQDITHIKTVETETIKVLTELSNKNIKTMGLTARPAKIIDLTTKQLNTINISLNSNPICANEIWLSNSSCYINGILYVGSFGHKGKALIQFLDKIKYNTKEILFIDDSFHHCKDIKEVLNKKNIMCTCIHYTAAKEKFASISPEQIHKEMVTYGDAY